jgi:hypothetical protein
MHCRPEDNSKVPSDFPIRNVTYDRDKPGLAGCVFRGPCEVTALKTESTVFQVSTTDSNGVDALGSELGARRLTAELKFSLLAVVGTLGTGLRAFVAG